MKGFVERWTVTVHPKSFFERIQANHIAISEVKIKEHNIVFHASVFKHKQLLALFPNAIVEPISLWHAFHTIFFQPSRCIALALMIILWLLLSQMTFAIAYDGDISLLKQLQSYMRKEVSLPAYDLNIESLKQDLKSTFHEQINWLAIRKKGSKLTIAYTAKENASLKQLNDQELIAQEDGVIRYFSLKHGEKAVHINDFVKKGDVLVKNNLETSRGELIHLNVEGIVYANTFQEVHVSMKVDKMPKALQFYRLLFRARSEVSKNFQVNDEIVEENILHFAREQGTITMVVLYTCCKDISTPRS